MNLESWFLVTFQARTQAIESGQSTNVDWLDPNYRITFAELTSKAKELGIDLHPVDLYSWWQTIYTKYRKLLKLPRY